MDGWRAWVRWMSEVEAGCGGVEPEVGRGADCGGGGSSCRCHCSGSWLMLRESRVVWASFRREDVFLSKDLP